MPDEKYLSPLPRRSFAAGVSEGSVGQFDLPPRHVSEEERNRIAAAVKHRVDVQVEKLRKQDEEKEAAASRARAYEHHETVLRDLVILPHRPELGIDVECSWLSLE